MDIFCTNWLGDESLTVISKVFLPDKEISEGLLSGFGIFRFKYQWIHFSLVSLNFHHEVFVKVMGRMLIAWKSAQLHNILIYFLPRLKIELLWSVLS